MYDGIEFAQEASAEDFIARALQSLSHMSETVTC